MDEKARHRQRIAEISDLLAEAMMLAAPERALTTRHMFGGAGYYVDSVMFAGYYGDGLALKLDEAAREELLDAGGHLQPISKGVVEVPDSWLSEPEKLAPWLVRAIAHSEARARKKKK